MPQAPLPLVSDIIWQQIADRQAKPLLIFGVTSTKIFCRAGCPARTPKRENIRLFRDGGDAEAAGFRACHRCKPLG